jgi:hypothetical protein
VAAVQEVPQAVTPPMGAGCAVDHQDTSLAQMARMLPVSSDQIERASHG